VGEPIDGRAEAQCLPDTLCVSGATPGSSELNGLFDREGFLLE